MRRPLVASAVVALALPVLAVLPASTASAAPAADPVVTKALHWLGTQQQPDGSFEVSGFPMFETPDATLALASAAQTGPAWNQSQALAAVQAVHTAGGKDALDYIDAQVDAEPTPATDAATQALAARTAKVLALVVAPLETTSVPGVTGSSLTPTDFDPAGDSADAVDLTARMDAVRNGDGSYDMPGQLNGVLYAALAQSVTGRQPTAALLSEIASAQKSDGSWSYDGDNTGTGTDIDTTALAVTTLVRSGVAPTDPEVAKAIAFLAAEQRTTGAWQSFDSDDPNSTAVAIAALATAGIDVTTKAWRDAADPARSGAAYASPITWLRSQQDASGRITSPNDTVPPINTFATTQALQVLGHSWFADGLRTTFVRDVVTDLATNQGGVPHTIDLQAASDALGPLAPSAAGRKAAVAAALASDDHRIAAANTLFLRVMGRPIDPKGQSYWSNQLRSISWQQMLASLTGSPEFFHNAGGTNQAFVEAVYPAVLFGRSGDAGGVAYWVGRLNAGAPRSAVARSFVTSDEYRTKEVKAQYQALVGHVPDPAASTYWAGQLRTDKVETLQAALAGSSEYLRNALG